MIHLPLLCRQGHTELLLNPRQVLLRELHPLSQELEIPGANPLELHAELQFCLWISSLSLCSLPRSC